MIYQNTTCHVYTHVNIRSHMFMYMRMCIYIIWRTRLGEAAAAVESLDEEDVRKIYVYMYVWYVGVYAYMYTYLHVHISFKYIIYGPVLERLRGRSSLG